MGDVATVERTIELPTGVDRVWAALTDGERLSEWFGARVEIDARQGGGAKFTWPDGSERRASVEAIENQHLLVLRWMPFDRDARGVTHPRPGGTIRFVLERHLRGARLRVTETRVQSFCSAWSAPTHPFTSAFPQDPRPGPVALARTGTDDG